jgi:ABC-2 type transport system ATP-binding protein
MLEVKNVIKKYGDIVAVDNLSFNIKEGEIFGLLGVNGAGKTTTFRMIIGLLNPTSGTITYNGKNIDYDLKDKIGFLTEERSLLTKMTVLEQAYFYGGLKSMREKEIEKRLDELLNEFEIPEYKNRKIKELSKGNQQKIQFIMSILNKPKLLLLDEPFSGLDPINIELFKKIILKLKKEKTMIIFSSHRMDHVEYFCDSLVILVKGKTVLNGKLNKIKEDYGKKNIKVIADVDENKISKIKGVLKVVKEKNELIISIKDTSVIVNVFDYVSKCKNVSEFIVEEPSLNEIFIDKVGKAYEK